MKLNKLTLLASILAITSCQQLQETFTNTNSTKFSNKSHTDAPYSFSNFSDVPIPEESSMVVEKTRVFGEKDSWVGTLYLNSPFKLGNIFNFYSSQMSEFDWKKLSVIRGGETILTYIREGRIATIFIEETSLSGTNISFTVSPIPNEIKDMFNKKENIKEKSSIPTPVSIEETQTEISSEIEKTPLRAGALNLGEESDNNIINNEESLTPQKSKPDKNGLSPDEESFFNF